MITEVVLIYIEFQATKETPEKLNAFLVRFCDNDGIFSVLFRFYVPNIIITLANAFENCLVCLTDEYSYLISVSEIKYIMYLVP